MHLRRFLQITSLALLTATPTLRAQEATAGQDELEAKFKKTMTGVTMSGNYTSLKDGALGATHDDKYSIVGVEKVSGSAWTMNVKFKGLIVPVPVNIKWAGDTAVIIVDNLIIPGAYGGALYSARVLVHKNTYSGTWDAGDHGGFISGLITSDTAAK